MNLNNYDDVESAIIETREEIALMDEGVFPRLMGSKWGKDHRRSYYKTMVAHEKFLTQRLEILRGGARCSN